MTTYYTPAVSTTTSKYRKCSRCGTQLTHWLKDQHGNAFCYPCIKAVKAVKAVKVVKVVKVVGETERGQQC